MVIIIYIIGCIVAVILSIKVITKKQDYTLDCVLVSFFLGILSWLGVLFILLAPLDGDIVIFKKKKK